MKPKTLVHCDAIELLERIPSEIAALVYFDPPWPVGHRSDDQTQGGDGKDLLTLYFHCACHAKAVMSDRGIVVWHVPPDISAKVRHMLDRVFGERLFVTEVVLRHQPNAAVTKGPRVDHSTLIVYSKTGQHHFDAPRQTLSVATNESLWKTDSDGRQYRLVDMTTQGNRPSFMFTWKDCSTPPGRSWRYSTETMEQLYSEGRIVVSTKGLPRRKVYLDESVLPEVGSVWDDIVFPPVERSQSRIAGQQSLKLMRRILLMFTQPNDLVVDPFCGSGTTFVAATQEDRVWLGGDNSSVACDTALSRLSSGGDAHCHVIMGEQLRADFQPVRLLTELVRDLKPLSESIAHDIHLLIAADESKTLEFKETLSLDVRANKREKFIELMVLKTIAAFLNSDGGTLLVGVTDKHVPVGLEREISQFHCGSHDKFLLHFKNLLKSNIGEQFYPLISYLMVAVQGQPILRVDCRQADKPCFIENDFYVRTNPATDKIDGPKMLAYVQRRFPVSER
jgi:hypothetical protein